MLRSRLGILALTTTLALVGCSGGTTAPESDGAKSPDGSGSHAAAQSGSDDSEDLPDPADIDPSDYQKEAADIVDGFSDDELAGSLIIGTWNGTDTQTPVNMITQNHLGGVIVMGYNLPENPTKDQVTGLTKALKGARTKGQPVSIGVDQEGGPVSRLSSAALPFPPLMGLAATDDSDLITEATTVQGKNLTDLGFTIDFAPDSDVTVGPKDKAINVRSAGTDHKDAAEVVADAVTGYRASGVGSSAKHFPGHGRLGVDSHESLPVSEKSIDELEDTDLLPFKSAVKAGVPMVMMGHIGLPDAKTTPASLNPKAYAALRKKLDFDGVIITDALNMKAVPQNLKGGETAKALAAGADLALMPADSGAAQKAIVAAMGDGTLKKKDVVEKSERVVAMQLATAAAQKSAKAGAGSGESSDGSDAKDAKKTLTEVAEKSVTVLKGECSFAGTNAISIVGGSEKEKAALSEAAKDAGLTVGSGGTSVSLSPSTSAEVAVGTAAPWTMRSTSAETAVTAYDSNPYALKAVAKWLKGDLRASGTLPAKYDGSDKAPHCS